MKKEIAPRERPNTRLEPVARKIFVDEDEDHVVVCPCQGAEGGIPEGRQDQKKKKNKKIFFFYTTDSKKKKWQHQVHLMITRITVNNNPNFFVIFAPYKNWKKNRPEEKP